MTLTLNTDLHYMDMLLRVWYVGKDRCVALLDPTCHQIFSLVLHFFVCCISKVSNTDVSSDNICMAHKRNTEKETAYNHADQF